MVVQIPNFRREQCSVAEEVSHGMVDCDAIGGGATALARCLGGTTGLCSRVFWAGGLLETDPTIRIELVLRLAVDTTLAGKVADHKRD